MRECETCRVTVRPESVRTKICKLVVFIFPFGGGQDAAGAAATAAAPICFSPGQKARKPFITGEPSTSASVERPLWRTWYFPATTK